MKTKGLTWFILLILSVLIFQCKTEQDKKSDVKAFSDPPQWSKEVVWYQIFVETFRNGDPSNDPTPVDIEGAFPGYIPESWEITPWTQDWYKEDSYFDELKGKSDNMGNQIQHFNQKAQLRRYGGDLQGVIDKIDYLDSLGITAVYFNPLNDAPSNHKFDVRNWRHIDRNFGPSPIQDRKLMEKEIPDDPNTWVFTGADKLFIELIEKLHSKGIKVIMDYSWNHVGTEFWAWQDVVEKQEESEYIDWFWITNFDDPNTPENEFDFHSWFDVKTLIELRETKYVSHRNSSFLFEGNFVSQSLKNHIFNISKRWLDPNGDGDPSDGVDGFRLDVCAEIPMGFWREYRNVVKGVNTEAYLVGETWFETYPNTMMDPKPLLEGDIFDGVMNYRWYKAAREYFVGSEKSITSSDFVDSLTRISSNLNTQNNLAMMNVASSHDSPRLLTSLFNKNSKYKYMVQPTDDNNYMIHKPDEDAFQTTRLLLAHQFTYFGSPHIWAGEEMGMWGADMGDTRKPLLWPDYNFEPENIHPFGKKRTIDKVKFDHDHFNYYQKLIQLREEHPVLKIGEIKYLIVDNKKNILAYSRFDENEEIIAVFNTSFSNHMVDIPVDLGKNFTDILNGNDIIKIDERTVRLTLPARSASILINKN